MKRTKISTSINGHPTQILQGLSSVVVLITLVIALTLSFQAHASSFSRSILATEEEPVPTEDSNTIPAIPLTDIQRFATVIAQIKHYYIKPVTYKKLFDNAIRGMLLELDPHSSFLDEKALKELQTITTGKFGGLGIEVLPENDYIRIISPLDDAPAKRAGLMPGDLIIRINKKPVKKMTASEAIHLMRGKKGSSVSLTILRKNVPKPLNFSIVRDIIKIKTVKSRMLEPGFGYIRIAFFHAPTESNLHLAIRKLKKLSKSKLKGVIIDLRDNPGGLLDSAVQVADSFLDYPQKRYDNLIVYTEGKIPDADIQLALTKGDKLKGVPIVVLINEGSASASEIVAGALQDYNRAVIVGTKSFGKGSVQTVLPTSKTTAIKLTTALYYTPSGLSIQAEGIKPDVVVPYLRIPEKVIKAANKHTLSIDEADLSGHLSNGNGHSKTRKTRARNKGKGHHDVNISNEQQEINSLTLAHKDFQLFEALNVLKGLTHYHPKNN